jgi:hypothetical protein
LREAFSDLSHVLLRDRVVEDESGPLHLEGGTRLILKVWALRDGPKLAPRTGYPHSGQGDGCQDVTRQDAGGGVQKCR